MRNVPVALAAAATVLAAAALVGVAEADAAKSPEQIGTFSVETMT